MKKKSTLKRITGTAALPFLAGGCATSSAAGSGQSVSGGWGYEEALTAVGAVCSIAGLATGGIGWAVGGVIVAGAGIGHMIYSNSKYNPNRR